MNFIANNNGFRGYFEIILARLVWFISVIGDGAGPNNTEGNLI